MTCKSSAIKALSCILILLSVIIFVNWIIAYVGDLDDYSWIFGYYYSRNAGYWFDGLWVGPILASGIIGKQNLLSSKRCAHFLQSNHLLFSLVYGSNSPKREFTAFKWEILPLKMRSNGRQKCNLKSVKGYSPTS